MKKGSPRGALVSSSAGARGASADHRIVGLSAAESRQEAGAAVRSRLQLEVPSESHTGFRRKGSDACTPLVVNNELTSRLARTARFRRSTGAWSTRVRPSKNAWLRSAAHCKYNTETMGRSPHDPPAMRWPQGLSGRFMARPRAANKKPIAAVPRSARTSRVSIYRVN